MITLFLGLGFILTAFAGIDIISYRKSGLKRELVVGVILAIGAVASWGIYFYDAVTGNITKMFVTETIEKDGYTYILDKNPPTTIESNGKTYILSETSTATPEEAPEIATVEIDGVSYAVMGDKLYEIVMEE